MYVTRFSWERWFSVCRVWSGYFFYVFVGIIIYFFNWNMLEELRKTKYVLHLSEVGKALFFTNTFHHVWNEKLVFLIFFSKPLIFISNWNFLLTITLRFRLFLMPILMFTFVHCAQVQAATLRVRVLSVLKALKNRSSDRKMNVVFHPPLLGDIALKIRKGCMLSRGKIFSRNFIPFCLKVRSCRWGEMYFFSKVAVSITWCNCCGASIFISSRIIGGHVLL